MIYLSSQATTEIKRLQSKQGLESLCFRLAVKSGGCSDLFYDLSFEAAHHANPNTTRDYTFDCNGIQVVIDEESLSYISNLRLEYSEDLMGGGFRFDNPQALSTCGCGNSFSIVSSEQVVTSC